MNVNFDSKSVSFILLATPKFTVAAPLEWESYVYSTVWMNTKAQAEQNTCSTEFTRHPIWFASETSFVEWIRFTQRGATKTAVFWLNVMSGIHLHTIQSRCFLCVDCLDVCLNTCFNLKYFLFDLKYIDERVYNSMFAYLRALLLHTNWWLY